MTLIIGPVPSLSAVIDRVSGFHRFDIWTLGLTFANAADPGHGVQDEDPVISHSVLLREEYAGSEVARGCSGRVGGGWWHGEWG